MADTGHEVDRGAHTEVGRPTVLAHRMAVQGLTEPVPDADDCRLLGLGIQNTPPGAGLIALNARTTQPPRAVAGLLDPAGPLAVMLAARGAPHVVWRSELPLLKAALAPLDAREAAETDEVSRAMRDVAGGEPISRPALSSALNDKVSDSLRGWCERCRSRHVREDLFRKATLQAGLEVDATATSPTMFRPCHVPLPTEPSGEEARVELARRYVHLTGVASPAEFAAWLGYQARDVRASWDNLEHELTRCDVAGKRKWALTSDLESLADGARRPEGVRLLPPSDPYLLGDRSILVPERVHQRQLWRALSSPGALLVAGEIAGTWRHRMSGGRLRITVYPFDGLDTTVMTDLARDAENVAAVREASSVDVTLGSA